MAWTIILPCLSFSLGCYSGRIKSSTCWSSLSSIQWPLQRKRRSKSSGKRCKLASSLQLWSKKLCYATQMVFLGKQKDHLFDTTYCSMLVDLIHHSYWTSILSLSENLLRASHQQSVLAPCSKALYIHAFQVCDSYHRQVRCEEMNVNCCLTGIWLWSIVRKSLVLLWHISEVAPL